MSAHFLKTLFEVIAAVILMFAITAGYTLLKVHQWERWDNSRRTRKQPIADTGVLLIILLVIATILVAFLYFRANFPH